LILGPGLKVPFQRAECFSGPLGLTEGLDTSLYVADYNAFGSGAIFKVSPNTGAQELVTSGGYFITPDDVEFTHGFLVLADIAHFANGFLVKVDPTNGRQTLLSSGGFFVVPDAIVAAPGNYVYVGDIDALGTGAILKVNLSTGSQSVVATGGYLNHPEELTVDTKGNIIAINSDGTIVRVNPLNGDQMLVSSQGLPTDRNAVMVARDGTIYVSSNLSPGTIFEVDRATGGLNPLTSGGLLDYVGSLIQYRDHNPKTPAPGTATTVLIAATPSKSLSEGRIIDAHSPQVQTVSGTRASSLPTVKWSGSERANLTARDQRAELDLVFSLWKL
jgi:hypothetical protein